MPKFSQEDIEKLLIQQKKIRNVVLIAAMGQGKTCVMDCIGAQCGLVAEDKIGESRFTHVRNDEKSKGCTLKMNVTSLVYGVEDKHLFHMIDTPGHAEYSAELSVALPLADGAVMVVDGSGGGLPAQTPRHLKDLHAGKIKPVLFVNRLDVSILVLNKQSAEIWDDFSILVDAFSTAMAAAMPGAPPLSPEAGDIIFGSAAMGWAFSIPQVASIYAKKFGIENDRMSKKMWGENYFSAKNKKWSNQSGPDSSRAFNQFIIDPILKVRQVCEGGDFAKLEKMMTALGVKLAAGDKEGDGKAVFRRVMQLWMPAGTCIGNAIVEKLPNPVVAQSKRFDVLSAGPSTDPSAKAIQACDPKGMMLFQCTKLFPMASTPGRFYAIGRVYSGTCTADKIQMIDEDFIPEYAREEPEDAEGAAGDGTPTNGAGDGTPGGDTPGGSGKKVKKAASAAIQERRIQGVQLCQTKICVATPSLPAGNIGALAGVDQFMTKRCSFSSSKDAFPLRAPHFNVSPVVRVSVSPQSAKDLPKTVEGLRRLAKSCPLVEITLEEGGDHVVAACGGEHIRMLRRDLESDYLPGIALVWSAPSVSYKETITDESSILCLAKSPNKHNRLFMKAEPLDEELCRAIEAKKIWQTQDIKLRSKLLTGEFSWEKNDTMKIWGFGPAAESSAGAVGANILVDKTKACQYLAEIKESVNSGLLWATKQGPICEEQMRGIRFNLLDVKLHTDSIHRGMGQIQPCARRVFFACTLTAEPKLVEPYFMANIDAPTESSGGIMQALGSTRGELVVSEEVGDRVNVQAYVPIAETIGNHPFATVLTQKTNGKAVVNYAFDHWSTMPSDPLNPGSKSNDVMMAIRSRKNLKLENPVLADYYDKL